MIYKQSFSLVIPYVPDGTILLQDRSQGSAKYGEEVGFFGGKIEDGEFPVDAIQRETREELGLHSSKDAFQRCGSFSLLGDNGAWYLNNLYALAIDTENTVVCNEGDGLVWTTPDSARRMKYSSELLLVLFDMFEGWRKSL